MREEERQTIRVLNVLFEERFGGPQKRVLEVARGLRPYGVETTVALPCGGEHFPQLLRREGIGCYEMDLVRPRGTRNPMVHARFARLFWPNVLELRRLIRRQRIDLVHTNGLPYLQAAFAARTARRPLVWHLNDTQTPAFMSTLPRLLATRIALASKAVGEHCFPRSRSLADRLQLVYAPVDVKAFGSQDSTDAVREEFSVPADAPLIGTIGHLNPIKGTRYFIQAFERIRERFPQARAIVVGEKLANRKAYWTSLIDLARNLGLSDSLTFAGRRDDIPRLLSAFTVYVHPSETEACPIAVLEASASGLPIVATDVGGTGEIVQNGINGFLVPPRSAQQVADRVIELLESQALRREFGTRSAQRTRQIFSLEACVESHVELYRTALKRPLNQAFTRYNRVCATESEERRIRECAES